MNLKAFFDAVRRTILGPAIDQGEVVGCEAIIDVCRSWPGGWLAYALATAYHETAGTMLPIHEYGNANYFNRRYGPEHSPALARELGNTQPGDGARFAGRGYVQLTGRRNYDVMGKRLGLDLVGNPELALRSDVAARILEVGMREGLFTGKSCASYMPSVGYADRTSFVGARRIINSTDKASKIAGYALQFQDALKAADRA